MNYFEPDDQNLGARLSAHLRAPTLPPGFRARLEQRIDAAPPEAAWDKWLVRIERLEALALAAVAAAIWFALPVIGRLVQVAR